MSNYATLIASIQSVITQNGNNEITGTILQQTLLSMINSLGSGYQFVGIATPETNPGTPDQRVFYIASSGTYPNFGPATIPAGKLAVFYYDTAWHNETCDLTAVFASGEAVNETYIDDTHLHNPQEGALPKANDVIDKCRDVKADIEDYKETRLSPTFIDGYYILSDGSLYGGGSSNNSYAEINVVGYDYIAFEGVSFKNSTANTAGFAFGHYTNNVWILDSAMPFINQNDQEGDYQSMEYVKHVPHNSTHVRVTVYTYLGVVSKQSFYCYGRNYVGTKKDVYENIDLELYRTTVLLRTGGKYSIGSSNKSYIIPVEEGSVVKFKARSVGSGGYTTPNGYLFRIDGSIVDETTWSEETLSGAKFISIEAGIEYEIEVPKGCTNIYFPVNRSTTYYFIDLEYFKVEKIEQEEKTYISVAKIKEEVGYYRVNGSLNTDTSRKSAFFKIDQDKNYYVNTRIGYLSASDPLLNTAYISYLADDMVTWLGYEEPLVAKGYNYYPHNYMLTLPEGTKYIMAYIPSSSYEFGVFSSVENAVVDAINYVESDIEETIWGNIEGSEESVPTIRKSAWGFRLPSNYNERATPTPIIAMLHGANGYVTPNVLGYGNDGGTATSDNWKEWQDKYLNAGFAVFDINGYGIYSEDHDSAVHSGNPMAIETMKKAFEYLKKHYNVADRMFIHGTSMGGGLAQSYIRVYPEDVISVALLAPQCNAYSSTITQGVGVPDVLARAWGYADEDEMIADSYSHFYNFNPLFNCLKIKKEDGSVAINKVSIEMMQDFIKDTDGITGDAEYQYVEKSMIPIKLWIGSADTTAPMSMERAVYNAYYNGGTNIKLRIVNGAKHSFCAGGSYTFVADEVIRFFKDSL